MVDTAPFQTELSASPSLAIRVPGLIAHFDLVDGRRIDVHVPQAITCAVEAGEVAGFRIEVRHPRRPTAVLTATDLLDVFHAQSAARAIAAFVAGDLARARRLARRAGAAWQGLLRLLRDVTVTRRGRPTDGTGVPPVGRAAFRVMKNS